MLYIFASIAIAFLFFALVFLCEIEDYGIGFICLGVAIVIGGLSALGYFGMNKKIGTIEKKTGTQEIVSLQDNTGIDSTAHRAILHVYVTIGSSGEYTYYYQLEDGAFIQGSVPASSTKIYEEENCTNPCVETYVTYSQNNWSKVMTSIFLFSKKDGKELDRRYELHVPKGTVVQEFLLDAKV